MTEPPLKPPKELDAIVDVVLAYKAKPKTKPAKNCKNLHKDKPGAFNASSSNDKLSGPKSA